MKPAVRERDTATDAILDHLFNGAELSDVHEEIWKRVQFAYNQIVDGSYTHRQVVKLIGAHCDVSETTAEKDIQRAKIVYRELRSIEVDAQYVIEFQLAEKILAMALKKGDPKAAAVAQKNKLQILARLQQMELLLDPKKFERHSNYLVVVLGKEDAETAIRLDLNNIEKLPLPERMKIMKELQQQKDEMAEFEIVENVK